MQGLIPSAPTLRPADILTSAAHAKSVVALDVGISAPHSLHAGLDCTETMKQTKMRYYGPYLEELERQNIKYVPITLSCFGRRHADTTHIMNLAARRAARYRGMPRHQGLLTRWYRSVAAEVWRRAAKMVHMCLPQPSRESSYLVTGEMEEGWKEPEDSDDEDPERAMMMS